MWRGKVQLKCGDGRKLLTWLLWAAPLLEGRALIAYLIGRGNRALIVYLIGRGARGPIANLIGRGLAPLVGRFGDFSPPACCS